MRLPLGRIGRASIGAALVVPLSALLVLGAAEAQTAKKSAKSAPAAQQVDEDGNPIVNAYDAGIKAWQGGKADQAVAQLTAAIGDGKLPPQQMAKALYVRGLAQRKLGKPALAISDLTSALWMKGGLSDSDRAEAQSARTSAYREAGLSEPAGSATARPATAPVVSASPPVQTAAQRPAAPAAAPAAAPPPPAPAATGEPNWKTRVQATGSARNMPAPATTNAVAAPAAPVAVPAPIPTVAQRAAAQPAVPAPIPVSAQAKPMQPASAPPPAVTATVPAVAGNPAVTTAAARPATSVEQPQKAESKGFFSSLFGDMSLGGGMPPSPPAIERRVPPPPDLSDPDAAKAQAQLDGWGKAKVSASGQGARVAAVQQGAATGNFRLQVGAAKSKQDAEKIAAQLKREQAKALGQRAVEVDQGGDVWRVRVGPYASANEPRNLCVRLRQSGYDCMVVTQ